MDKDDKATAATIAFFVFLGITFLTVIITLGKWADSAIAVWKLEQQLTALSGAGIDSALVTEIARILAETIK